MGTENGKYNIHFMIKVLLFLIFLFGQILESYDAARYVDGSAVHYYFDDMISADVLSITQYDYPDKFILATEGCAGN